MIQTDLFILLNEGKLFHEIPASFFNVLPVIIYNV